MSVGPSIFLGIYKILLPSVWFSVNVPHNIQIYLFVTPTCKQGGRVSITKVQQVICLSVPDLSYISHHFSPERVPEIIAAHYVTYYLICWIYIQHSLGVFSHICRYVQFQEGPSQHVQLLYTRFFLIAPQNSKSVISTIFRYFLHLNIPCVTVWLCTACCRSNHKVMGEIWTV